jgi:hypothetical protein
VRGREEALNRPHASCRHTFFECAPTEGERHRIDEDGRASNTDDRAVGKRIQIRTHESRPRPRGTEGVLRDGGRFAVLSFAMIGGWFFYDRRPDA